MPARQHASRLRSSSSRRAARPAPPPPGGQPGLAAPVRQPEVMLLALVLDRDLERRDDDVERLAAAQPGWAGLADDLDAGQRRLDAAHEMELADPALSARREAQLRTIARLHLGEELG